MDDETAAALQPKRNGPCVGARLHGLFTDPDDGRVSYALSLSDTALSVQRLGSAPGCSPPPELLQLRDCLGSRAHRPERDQRAACLCVYFYPLRHRWMSSGPVRQREERRFRVELSADESEDEAGNLLEAERWASAITHNLSRLSDRKHGVLLSEVCGSGGVMVLVNPQSGRGQALSLYNTHVQRMFSEADIPHTLVITEHQNHARDVARSADLSRWDAFVILSGDGLLFEVLNGLMERPDWEKAIQTPVGILPGGSGNALAAALHHCTRAAAVYGEDLLVSCGFLLCKGVVSPLDLISIRLASGARLFSFLSLAWGFVADVDVESEQLRHMGGVRFLLGALVRLAALRVYRGTLAFLPADTPMPRPDGPAPQEWTRVEQQEFVLVLAVFQSHLSEELLAAPEATPHDGLMHLFYVTAGVSRAALLRMFRAMQSGTHLDCGCPHLVYRRARALRLEPEGTDGVMTVDGERVEYGPLQAQVHHGMARLVSPPVTSDPSNSL